MTSGDPTFEPGTTEDTNNVGAKQLHERPAAKKVVVSEPPKRPSSGPKKKKTTKAVGNESEEPKQSKAEISVEFILNPNRDDMLVKPYHECGNPKMYTAEGLRKRAALKEHNAVKDSLNRFCRLFPAVDGRVTKEAYCQTHDVLSQILRPDLDEVGRAELAEVDWEQDTQGSGVLTLDMLMNILFQFVDIWAQTAEATEYMLLLDELLLKVTTV
mmetsp:Transcript_123802/g.214624  ORF Transcript_123802/g.214624 Transcript_123802/m.214624 type:complete len:214 (-) Transcript_123802:204-845(-)